jgi:hypothetical protein
MEGTLLNSLINSLDTEIKKICYTQKMTITVLTFYDGILLSSLPHPHAMHSLQAMLFVSLQAQLQSTPCICCINHFSKQPFVFQGFENVC